jgi:hypothetical protein
MGVGHVVRADLISLLLQALSVNLAAGSEAIRVANLAAGSEAIRVARITRRQIFCLDDQSRPLSR